MEFPVKKVPFLTGKKRDFQRLNRKLNRMFLERILRLAKARLETSNGEKVMATF